MQMDDPRIFPQQYGVPFPYNFMDVVRTVFKRLFRVYAHIYHTHFRSVCGLGEEAHLNTCFKHFMYFTQVSVSAIEFEASACTRSMHSATHAFTA